MNRKVEVDLKNNFAKAVVGIDPPPDPADVDNAIKRMKTIYHKVAGLPCKQAAIATARLIHKFHGAAASDQARIGNHIINIANLAGQNLPK